ncbi:hypothetical protein OIV83_003967 [Microbotryomycetes sp. JL201]|nr:hypothetical protein OIV83_003967 [Microbotryomycetes sp. JL201]
MATGLNLALSNLSFALEALPTALSPKPLAQLPRLLTTLAQDLTPLSETLFRVEQQAQLSNATFVAAGLTTTLNGLVSTIPKSDVQASDRDTLLAIIETGTTPYTVMTTWAPELMFLFGLVCKGTLAVLVKRRAVERARIAHVGFVNGGVMLDREMAKLVLTKPAKAMIGHSMNLIVSTVVLGLQLAAYRMFAVPAQPMRFIDVKLVLVSIKLLSVAYAVELCFVDVNPEIVLHHVFTFALFLAGQVCAYRTSSPKFFRLANWLTLQATLEQPTYFAMMCYHSTTYLRLQNSKTDRQQTLLKSCYRSLVLTKWITYPQKIVPAVMSLYWLGRMWNDIDHVSDGRFWIGWCLSLVVTLLILQIKFCDDIWPLTAYVRSKLDASTLSFAVERGEPVPRTGPVMTLVFHIFARRHGASRREPRQLDGTGSVSPSTIDFKHFSEFSKTSSSSVTKSPFPSGGGHGIGANELPIAMLFVHQSASQNEVSDESNQSSFMLGDVELARQGESVKTRTTSLQRSLSETVSKTRVEAPRPIRSRSSHNLGSIRRSDVSVVSLAASEGQEFSSALMHLPEVTVKTDADEIKTLSESGSNCGDEVCAGHQTETSGESAQDDAAQA